MDFIVTHGKLKERDARRIFRQVVEAIDYCHEVHVIRTFYDDNC
jgi:MAP/microtubule affinity-regulating kinase